jgi:hypothetical protein
MLLLLCGRIIGKGPAACSSTTQNRVTFSKLSEKPPAVIPEWQGVTGHNVRHVLFFGLAPRALPDPAGQVFHLSRVEIEIMAPATYTLEIPRSAFHFRSSPQMA